MDTQTLFLLLVLLVVAERLVELTISRRHERALRRRGAREVGAEHYPWMVLVHSTWLLAGPLEVWWFDRPFIPALAAVAGTALLATMALRYWVIATLGERWTTRVLVPPGEPRIVAGPYRFLRHPNYLAVAVEVVALPLIHTAWLTAILWGAANLAVLAVRIRSEDRALRAATEPGA